MFGWFKKREKPRLVIVDTDDAERGRIDAMRDEQRKLQRELGFDPFDDVQSWLRLHQILKDHEDRLKALEGEK